MANGYNLPTTLLGFIALFLVVVAAVTFFTSSSSARQPFLHTLASYGVSPPPIPEPFTCTEAQTLNQVKLLRTVESRCPGTDWWVGFMESAMTCSPVVVVNIGANKGYSLASFLDLFRPELGITPAAVGPLVRDTGAGAPCGACNDCEAGHIPRRQGRACFLPSGERVPSTYFPVAIFGVEPIPGNIAIINKGVHKLFQEKSTPDMNATLSIHRFAAVGNEDIQTVPFGQCPPGIEGCGVEEEGTVGKVTSWNPEYRVVIEEVPATTVDSLSARLGIEADFIDILAIDAEGLDPEILDGAYIMLADNLIKVVEFEYHHQRAWKTRNLKDVVESMSNFGYDCFLAQSTTFIRLTGCWDPAYEFKDWSNVICVVRKIKGLVDVAHSFAPGLQLQSDSKTTIPRTTGTDNR